MKRKNRKLLSLIVIPFFILTLAFQSVILVEAAETGKLVAHYKFDGDLKDYSGNNNNGVAAGNKITYTDAVIGKGAKFDGSTYIEVKDSNSLDLRKALTISVWVYKENPNSDENFIPILSKGENEYCDETTPYALYYDYDGYRPNLRLSNTEAVESLNKSDLSISHQKWHLMTTTWQGKTVKFYVDGILKGNAVWNGGELYSSGDKLLIGANIADGTWYLTGILDDLRIYDYALTDADIKVLYDSKDSQNITTKEPETKTDSKDTSNTEKAKSVPKTLEVGKPVAYYPFNEDLKDYSGNKNDGTGSNNKHAYVKGMMGNGLKLDGSNYVLVKDSDSLDLHKAFTISAWVYKDRAINKENNIPLVSKGEQKYANENTPYMLYYDYDGYRPTLRLVNQDMEENLNSDIYFSYEKWHLLTVTLDGKTVKYYIDGVLKDNSVWEGGELFSSADNLFIGANISEESWYFNGVIDDLRIYDYALKDEDIKLLYNSVMDAVDKSGKMVALYRFEDNLLDSSKFKNNGTASGEISYAEGRMGKAVRLDGASYIEVADSDSLDFDKEFTITAWVYKENSDPVQNIVPVVSKGEEQYINEDTPYAVYYDYDGLRPCIRLTNLDIMDEIVSDQTISNEKWHMLTVSFKGKSVKYYIDGVLKATKTWEGNEMFHSPGKLFIGAILTENSVYFKGMLDDLRLYNYELTDNDIKLLHNTVDYKSISSNIDSAGSIDYNSSMDIKITAVNAKGEEIDVTKDAAIESDNTDSITIFDREVCAVGLGESTVSIKYGSLIKTFKLKVKDTNEYYSIGIFPPKSQEGFALNKMIDLEVHGSTTKAYLIDISKVAKIESSNPKAFIIVDGKLQRVGSGTANISVSYQGFKYTLRVKDTNECQSIAINGSKLDKDLSLNDMAGISVYLWSNASSTDVSGIAKIESSNPKVIKIVDGKLQKVGVGTSIITISYDGLYMTYRIDLNN